MKLKKLPVYSDENALTAEVFKKPTTRYTKSGSINIAYQVFGSGSRDIVYVPGWVSNIDWMWECPELVSFLRELGKTSRVILFDKRGTGLSDRVVELSTLEERMDDIRAVMDAVESQKAVLFGHSEGGCASALFSATYPNRVSALISFGIFAKRRYSSDYPWAPTDQERQKVYDMIEQNWGNGEMGLESLAPSKAGDKKFMEWLSNYFRSGASPSAAMVLTKMNTQVDITNILSAIKVPALVLQRTHDIDVKIEEGRFIAERIAHAQFVELAGDDHLFWVGDTAEVLRQIEAFMSSVTLQQRYVKQLLNTVAVRIVSNEKPHPNRQALINDVISRYRGSCVQFNDSRLIATFEGPVKATHCSMDLIDLMNSLNAKVAIGIHIREVAMDEVGFVSADTEQFAEAILDKAKPDQVLVTHTVKSFLWGTGFEFSEQPARLDLGTGGSLPLYEVTDPDHLNIINEVASPPLTRKDSFFEMVMQCINSNLKIDSFNVESLCRDIGTSERQLQRKLKTVSNKSPNQLISSVRMYRAKELLLSGEFNVSEVAYQIGFTSPSYFAKRFKKEFGISPSVLSAEQ